MVVAVAVVGAVGYAAMRTSAAAAPSGALASTASTFRVTGYAETGATTAAQLTASKKLLTTVGVDGVNLTADGDGVTAVDPESLALLADAHHDGKKAELLFGNFSDELGDFSDPLAEKMFASPANIQSVVATLTADVNSGGWDGITVDLESLNDWGDPAHKRDDNAGLDAFVTALRTSLGDKTVSICLSATSDSYTDLGYDLPVLSKQVNNIVLMAYDQHGPTWSNAGPVGGYPWVKSTVAKLVKSVPRSRVQLGVGEYGYSWPGDAEGGGDGNGRTFTDAEARAYVKSHHGKAVWSSTQKEWHSTLADGTVIWWSDHKSFEARLSLAHRLRLGGVAVWSLGEGDPL